MGMSLLHVGCGGDILPDYLHRYQEVRLDIDSRHSPDIVASMLDLGDIGQFDAVYCSHALEHVYPHEVTVALKEFYRVIKTGGILILFVPDLEGVKASDEVLFVSPAGPITGLDLIYGMRSLLKEQPYMAHKTGFTSDVLKKHMDEAGFSNVIVARHEFHNLSGIGVK